MYSKSITKGNIEFTMTLQAYCIRIKLFQVQTWQEYELLINSQLIATNQTLSPFRQIRIIHLYQYLGQHMGDFIFDAYKQQLSFHASTSIGPNHPNIKLKYILKTQKSKTTQIQLLKNRFLVNNKHVQKNIQQLGQINNERFFSLSRDLEKKTQSLKTLLTWAMVLILILGCFTVWQHLSFRQELHSQRMTIQQEIKRLNLYIGQQTKKEIRFY